VRDPLRRTLEALLGERIAGATGVGGGSIGESLQVVLESDERCFVKHYQDGPPGLASAEARGLEWLREAESLPVARVRAVDDDASLLVLEWIESAPAAADFEEDLGRGLAALHRRGADGFGLPEDNFIGSLPQSNRPHESWPEFYAAERLEPLLRRARDEGRLPDRIVRQGRSLLDRLPSLCGCDEPPARLHGDLWSGNLMVDSAGRPCLVDPAVYGGHREMDLAMMRLFGGFSPRTFDAYAESSPLSAGAQERTALWQLYPLLVHVVLFGGGYAGSVEEALRRYL